MTIQLDHILVPSRDKNASAKLLAEILGVRWEPSGEERQSKSPAPSEWISGDPSDGDWQQYRAQRASVYVNDSLTLDFVSSREPVSTNHYCFRVSDADFGAAVERIKKAGVKFGRAGVGEPDYKISTRLGGKGVYFMEPDGHTWELLTVSYARPRKWANSSIDYGVMRSRAAARATRNTDWLAGSADGCKKSRSASGIARCSRSSGRLVWCLSSGS